MPVDEGDPTGMMISPYFWWSCVLSITFWFALAVVLLTGGR